MESRTRVALSLGSGGARGYAHIGALEVIAERGLEVVTVAGTSMGALVGGIAAAGKLPEYTDWARSLTQREVWRLLDLTITSPGAIKANRILAKVAEIVEKVNIEDMPIPFTAVATDVDARREVWFQRGPLEHAIRASIAIPGVITPVVINGRLLVDGGLMNPVPIEPLAATPADLTIAVSLAGHESPRGASSPVQETSAEPEHAWTNRIRKSAAEVAAGVLEGDRLKAITTRLGVARSKSGAEPTDKGDAFEEMTVEPSLDPAPGNVGVMDLLNSSYDTMSTLIERFRMAANPPDVLVSIPSGAVGTLDFHRAAEMIDLGRTLTAEALDKAGY